MRLTELRENLVVLGEAVDRMFAEDHLTVDHDVEDASTSLDESALDAVVILDGGGQTGRLGLVVSLHAVGDGDIHAVLVPRGQRDPRDRLGC